MDLVDIMLSEISQKEKNTVSLHLYVESKTQNKDKHKQNKANENETKNLKIQRTDRWLLGDRGWGSGVGVLKWVKGFRRYELLSIK